MTDRPSRPLSSPNRTPIRLERRIIALRFNRHWGPHRIGYHLGTARSTVGRVLARLKMPLLRTIGQATGLSVRKAMPVRYETSRPAARVHLDIKKQGHRDRIMAARTRASHRLDRGDGGDDRQ